ncbi:MAG: hypothetical protein K8R23_15520 [Chthoniobacter sp.]|nr:hypothetical protein [Chthoniobacter sp.]
MTATGMFCRKLDLVPPTDHRMTESAETLKLHPMNFRNLNLYNVYHATLALYQHQGPIWTEWNDRLKEPLPLLQKKDRRRGWPLGFQRRPRWPRRSRHRHNRGDTQP